MIWFFIILALVLIIYLAAKQSGAAECRQGQTESQINEHKSAKKIRERLRYDRDFAKRVREKFRR